MGRSVASGPRRWGAFHRGPLVTGWPGGVVRAGEHLAVCRAIRSGRNCPSPLTCPRPAPGSVFSRAGRTPGPPDFAAASRRHRSAAASPGGERRRQLRRDGRGGGPDGPRGRLPTGVRRRPGSTGAPCAGRPPERLQPVRRAPRHQGCPGGRPLPPVSRRGFRWWIPTGSRIPTRHHGFDLGGHRERNLPLPPRLLP